jgi:hypothetical protein
VNYSDRVQHVTSRHSAVQYSVLQCSVVLCSTVQYSTVQCSTVQYSAVQYNTVLQDKTVQCNVIQYSAERSRTETFVSLKNRSMSMWYRGLLSLSTVCSLAVPSMWHTAGMRARFSSLILVVTDMYGEMLMPSGTFSNQSAECSVSAEGARGRYLWVGRRQ